MPGVEYQQSNNLCVKWQIYTSMYLCVYEEKLVERMISWNSLE